MSGCSDDVHEQLMQIVINTYLPTYLQQQQQQQQQQTPTPTYNNNNKNNINNNNNVFYVVNKCNKYLPTC
jgi:hypothetical protein